MTFGTVAILGPGLIGGSLALALAKKSLVDRLLIYARSPHALDEIRISGVNAELTGNPGEAVREADVVVLCVPIEAMAGLIAECREALPLHAFVTDVGSVKGSVDAALAPLLAGHAAWIGSHPMAGSEQSGFAAARPDLFENAAVIVTPTAQTPSATVARAREFWRALGGRVFEMAPAEHDLSMAAISHMPHFVAALLAARVGEELLPLAGGGFRDTTRVAAGAPELWTEILWANRAALHAHCRAWAAEMEKFTGLFADDNEARKSELYRMLESAQSVRSRLAGKPRLPRS